MTDGATSLGLAALRHSQRLTGGATMLTAREQEVCSLVAQGLFDKEIAWRLGVRVSTVKHHMGKIMRKLKARNRVEVALTFRHVLSLPKR